MSIFSRLFSRSASNAAPADQAAAGLGLTAPVVSSPAGTFQIVLTKTFIKGAGDFSDVLDFRSHDRLIALLLPFEDAELVSATFLLNLSPTDNLYSTIFIQRSGGTPTVEQSQIAFYAVSGFHSKYNGTQHVFELPPDHAYGLSLKATNLGNPAPQIGAFLTGSATSGSVVVRATLVVRPVGVYVP